MTFQRIQGKGMCDQSMMSGEDGKTNGQPSPKKMGKGKGKKKMQRRRMGFARNMKIDNMD